MWFIYLILFLCTWLSIANVSSDSASYGYVKRLETKIDDMEKKIKYLEYDVDDLQRDK